MCLVSTCVDVLFDVLGLCFLMSFDKLVIVSKIFRIVSVLGGCFESLKSVEMDFKYLFGEDYHPEVVCFEGFWDFH